MRAMKDSGVEWIGEIPLSWQVVRNKNLFYEVNERCTGDDVYQLLSVSEYYGVAPKADKINDGDMITHAESLEGYKKCKRNDIIMNIMLAWKRATGISNYEGIISPAYCVYRSRGDINTNYYHYLFRTDVCANLFKQYSTGVIDSRLRLYSDKFFSLPMIVPPIEIQSRIADYLDDKCGKIDAIIAREKAVIEKLKEYKLSVITEAVTKGLNPDAPMKDSGVEWIGEVPEDVEVIQLKYLIKEIESGVSVNAGQEEAKEGEFGVLKTSSVSKFDFDIHENKSVNYDEKNRVRCPIKANTIIVSRMNTPELVGACGFISENYDNIFLPDRLWQVHLIETVNVKYIWYYLRSRPVRNYYASLSTGTSSSMQNISQSQFSHVYVSMPKRSIQNNIVHFLDKKCAGIDSAITQKQAVIEKLTAYKKSLIYEVVTGKKEV